MGRPLINKMKPNWQKQFLKTKKIGEEQPLNKQGFWKRPDYPHVTDKETSRN